jgi:hypothetical protein
VASAFLHWEHREHYPRQLALPVWNFNSSVQLSSLLSRCFHRFISLSPKPFAPILAVRFCGHCHHGRLDWRPRFLASSRNAFDRKTCAFHPVAAGHGLLATLAKVRFVAYTAVFGLIASAQLVFGVVAPFLYQQKI